MCPRINFVLSRLGPFSGVLIISGIRNSLSRLTGRLFAWRRFLLVWLRLLIMLFYQSLTAGL
jgi:hypothetical protein